MLVLRDQLALKVQRVPSVYKAQPVLKVSPDHRDLRELKGRPGRLDSRDPLVLKVQLERKDPLVLGERLVPSVFKDQQGHKVLLGCKVQLALKVQLERRDRKDLQE